ncbi:transposase [bacterium]|nr:transposase [bacterium]
MSWDDQHHRFFSGILPLIHHDAMTPSFGPSRESALFSAGMGENSTIWTGCFRCFLPVTITASRSADPGLSCGGRPWADNRSVPEGILWVLRTGARWKDLPPEFPGPSTCRCRLRMWEEQDVWLNIWRAFLSELDERKQLEWAECFADGSHADRTDVEQDLVSPAGTGAASAIAGTTRV